ncbi:hypothetical protein BDV59DRAFT_203284 [Aspergillus ambiguus]|uniref:uncharacterized protein n=1 Tax=Aspergillus ambiguus TaxID=176160 RepID=UPI003CCCB6C9
MSTNITVDFQDSIGIIKVLHSLSTPPSDAHLVKFNRPAPETSWSESLLPELLSAFRKLNDHPRTGLTLVASDGPFHSIVNNTKDGQDHPSTNASKIKVFYMRKFIQVLLHSIIHHKKPIVLALDGPPAWGGPVWVEGVLDILEAAATAYLGVSDSTCTTENLRETVVQLSSAQNQSGTGMEGQDGRNGPSVGERLSVALDAAHASDRSLDRGTLENFLKTIQPIDPRVRVKTRL